MRLLMRCVLLVTVVAAREARDETIAAGWPPRVDLAIHPAAAGGYRQSGGAYA